MRRMRHLKPREIQGCQLALDASIPTSLYDATSGGSLVAADGAVARWEDQSGVGRHVTQATGGKCPLRKVASFSGMDSILFDGSNDVLTRATQTLSDFGASSTDTGVFIVLKQTGTQAQNTQLSIGTKIVTFLTYDNALYFDAGDFTTSRISAAQPSGWDDSNQCFDGVRRSADMRLYTNNVFRVSRANATGTLAGTSVTLAVGGYDATPSIPSKGSIAELFVVAATISEFIASRARHSRMRKWRIAG